MKFALCNEMFSGWSLDRQFRFIAECGYNGVELAPFTLDSQMGYADPPTKDVCRLGSDVRKKIAKLAADCGIKVSGLHWLLAKTEGFYLTSPDKAVQKKTAKYFCELARFCRDLGGEYMVLGSPQQRNLLPKVSMVEAYNYAKAVLDQVLPVLEDTRVLLALEPLSPVETNFIQTGSDARFLIEKMGCPKYLGIHLDCKAMFGSEKEPMDKVLRDPKLRPYIKTFHANDPNLQGPGFGNLDFQPIMQALKDISFDGWVGVEPFDYSPTVERLGRESIANLKKYL